MVKILAVIVISGSCGFSFAGVPGDEGYPEVQIEYKVALSSAMETALRNYDPEFEIWGAKAFAPLLRNIYEYKSAGHSRPFFAWQTPSAVIGDFNGDNLPDAALLGRNKTHGKRIAVMSAPAGYSVVEFTEIYPLTDPMVPHHKKGEGNLEEYLELLTPRKIKAEPAFGRPEIDLKTDAFQFGVFEKASGVYLYKNGKFVDYALSD